MHSSLYVEPAVKPEDLMSASEKPQAKPRKPIGVLGVAAGVFIGSLAFVVVAALIYGFESGQIVHW